MLSRAAREFAAEIAQHDWTDAPYRIDRAGHDRKTDTNKGPDILSVRETDHVRLNVCWVAGQVLGYSDPNFDITEFAEACGVRENRPGILRAGLRAWNGAWARPGTYVFDDDLPLAAAPTSESSPPAKVTGARRVGITLDLGADFTWGDLRRFVELSAAEDHEMVGLAYDENETIPVPTEMVGWTR